MLWTSSEEGSGMSSSLSSQENSCAGLNVSLVSDEFENQSGVDDDGNSSVSSLSILDIQSPSSEEVEEVHMQSGSLDSGSLNSGYKIVLIKR